MPQTVVIGLLVLGAVLLLIAITGGQFKIFVAEVDTPVSSKPVRVMAGLLGIAFIAGALVLNRSTAPDGHKHANKNGGDGSASASTSGSPGSQTGAALPSTSTQNSTTNPAVSNNEYAIVFDPPTNIRVGPTTSSNVQCSVTSKTSIKILGSEGNWYKTDICGNGQAGYIYRNQVQF
jgi:hypothetical protein